MGGKDVWHLFSSMFVCFVVAITLSSSISYNIVQPLILESKLVTFGRYSFANEAIETIANDDSPSVVGIGSSMIFKAFDGECMGGLSSVDGAKFYNLGIPASRPYTDMMQIPQLSRTNVDVVVLEVGTNLLFKMTDGPHEYLEFRFTLQTMLQDDSDLGEWVDLVLPYHQRWLYLNEYERTEARQSWMIEAADVTLERLLKADNDDNIEFRFLPEPGTKEWSEYLQKPGWPASVIDKKTPSELEEYNETVLKVKSSYKPLQNGTRNHDALDYIISELTNSGIKVILLGLPHHPLKYPYLEPGQWDGYNHTIHSLSEKYDADVVDFTFEQRDGWNYQHFSDGNHLDDEGRLEFCQRMTPILNAALNS